MAEHAAAKFADWGIVAGSDSRLRQAATLLRDASSRELRPGDSEILHVLRALWTVTDFVDIAGYLPTDRVKSIRQELCIALRGPLWPPTGRRQPLQYQTQHWVGAVMVHAGLEINHVRFSAKRPGKGPEFWIPNGLSRIGVEVKRPESIVRLPATIVDAMDKFRHHDCYAAIVLELSDCVTPGSEVDVRGQADSLMDVIHRTIWDDELGQYKAGFGKLIYAGGLVRGSWERMGAEGTHARFFGHSFHQGYSLNPNSLQGIRSKWLQDFMNTAFSDVIWRMNDISGSQPVG